jgi:hypothetical protein
MNIWNIQLNFGTRWSCVVSIMSWPLYHRYLLYGHIGVV